MIFRALLIVLASSLPHKSRAQSLHFFGDSNTICSQGTGITNEQKACWAALSSYDNNMLGVNNAANGNTIISQADNIYLTTPTSTNRYQLLIGTNDQRLNGTNAAKREAYKRAMGCGLGWLALNGKRARTDASWSFSGTWSNTVAYGIGKASQVPGNTASFIFTGTEARICGIMQNGQTGIASVSVDGVSVGTWTFAAPATLDAPGYAPMPFDITGLTPGSHTVTITHQSGAYVFLDWYATGSASRAVTVGTIPRMSAAGYATYTGSDANVAAYNADLLDAVATLNATFGAAIKIADVHGAVNPATDLLADGIHLDQSGHWATAAAFKNAN
jgi:hypothetical protein